MGQFTRALKIPTPAMVPTNIPMYEDDLAELDRLVEKMKALGGKHVSRARLVRIAIRLLHDQLPTTELLELLETMPTRR